MAGMVVLLCPRISKSIEYCSIRLNAYRRHGQNRVFKRTNDFRRTGGSSDATFTRLPFSQLRAEVRNKLVAGRSLNRFLGFGIGCADSRKMRTGDAWIEPARGQHNIAKMRANVTHPRIRRRYNMGARRRRPRRPGSFSSEVETPVRMQSSITCHIFRSCNS